MEFEEIKPLQFSMVNSESDNLEHQLTNNSEISNENEFSSGNQLERYTEHSSEIHNSDSTTSGSRFGMTLRKKTLRIEVENFLKKKRQSSKPKIKFNTLQNENSRKTEGSKRKSLSKKSDTCESQSSKVCKNAYSMMRFHCPKCIKNLSLKDTIYARGVPENCKICHSKIKYVCKKCQISFKSLSGIRCHIQIGHVDPKNFQCAHCTYKTCWKKSLIVHLTRKHGFASNIKVRSPLKSYDKIQFRCRKCKVELTLEETNNRLDNFLKYCKKCDTVVSLHCKQCDRVYKDTKNMINHIKYYCGKPPRFTCQQCNYGTHYSANFKRHIAKHNA